MPTNQTIIGELTQKRTKNAKHYLLADGSYQAVIFMGDVHYEDEGGNLQNIDTTLIDEADFDEYEFPVTKHKKDSFHAKKQIIKGLKGKGSLDRSKVDFHGLRVPFAATLPKQFKRGYSVGKGINKITFKPIAASPSIGYIDPEKPNVIQYQDAWNDVDVTLELTERGVKETLILKTSKAPISFSFEVDGDLADNLTAGELLLENAWLEDANKVRRDVAQTVRRESGKVFVDIQADVTGLAFPIIVDPTTTIQPDTTTSKDTFVTQLGPTSNYGGNTSMWLGGNGSPNYEVHIALLQFDISSISIGSYISTANIELYLTADTNNLTNVYCNRNTSSWNEYSVTYNTRPSYVDDGDTRSNTVYPEGPLTLSCKNTMQKWVDGTSPNYGVSIISSLNATRVAYSGNETGYPSRRPKLTVTYNEPPTAPIVTAPNGGETWNASHTITWNASTDKDNFTQSSVMETATTGSIAWYAGVTDVASGNGTLIMGQSFTVSDTNYIKSLTLKLSSGTVLQTGATMRLVGVDDATGRSNGTVYYSGVPTIDASGFVTLEIGTGLSFPNGTKLAVEYLNNVAYNMDANNANSYSSGNFYRGSTNYTGYDLYLKVLYATFPLQYHIQKTTDNGTNWSDVIALTAAGATSYTYDFTSTPETSTAKIRIRAYDGTSYGAWDESNGVFTIVHNQAPTAPTLLAPSGGTSIDRAIIQRLSWQHNDPNSNDPQSKFDLQWRPTGTTPWNTVTQVTPNQYWDAVANTFAKGNVEWQVRTYDQAGLSGPYSTQATFYAGDKPAIPTIISPTDNGIVAMARPTLQWSSADQTKYQAQVLSAVDAVLWDTGEVTSTNKAVTTGIDLSNSTTYKLRVRIKNADGLWSDWATVTINVSYTAPPTAALVVTDQTGKLSIAITNPTPQGSEPTVTTNDLYRKKSTETTWTRIKTGIANNGSYVDHTPETGITYDYYVRTHGSNGTYKDSATYSGSTTFTGVWLHDVSDPAGTVHQYKYDGQGRNADWKAEVAMMQFAGRSRPVSEFGESGEGRVTAQLQLMKADNDLEKLRTLVYRKGTVCYRDGKGRKVLGIISNLPEQDEFYGVTTTIEVIESSYSEEV